MSCTPLPPSPLTPLTVCACSDGFNGASDFFDARVAFDPVTNTWLTTACANSVVGGYVMYTVFLLTLVVREVIDLVEFVACVERRKVRALSLYSNMQFRVVAIDGLIGTPCLIAMCILKLATDEVIGTDAAVTVLCAVGFALWIAVWVRCLSLPRELTTGGRAIFACASTQHS